MTVEAISAARSYSDAARQALIEMGSAIEPKRSLKEILEFLKPATQTEGPDQAEKHHLLHLDSRLAHIQRILDHATRNFRVSSSFAQRPVFDTLRAPNDGVVPSESDRPASAPRNTWWLRKGTLEWMQYNLPEKQTISEADVSWYFYNKQAKPHAWEILTLDDQDKWQPVHLSPDSMYTAAPKTLTTVKFAPVTTKAVRIQVALSDGGTAGLFEFRVRDSANK